MTDPRRGSGKRGSRPEVVCVFLCAPQRPRPAGQTERGGGQQQPGGAIGEEQQEVAGDAREGRQRVSFSCTLSSTRRPDFKQEAEAGGVC